MTPSRSIRAATLDAATVIGHAAELGSIVPGKFADLIAVAGNPLDDVRVLENVAHVIKDGKIIK
jgi:imidazolonepropionase-like amidohydrolase